MYHKVRYLYVQKKCNELQEGLVCWVHIGIGLEISEFMVKLGLIGYRVGCFTLVPVHIEYFIGSFKVWNFRKL